MMNVDNKDIDLGLALSISNICVQTRWNNNSGAGVNAGSKTFLASDPLKELVWSPENGPSLKCAAHSFADKKYSFQWDVGPSNIVCSPSHSIISKGAKDKKSTSEGNLVASQGTGYLNNEVDRSASLGQSSRRSAGSLIGSRHNQKGLNIEEVNSEQHSKREEGNYKEKESRCSSKNIQLGILNMTVTAEISTGQADQRTANLLPLLTDEPRPDMEETILLLGGFKEEGVSVPVSETENIDKDHQKLALDIALASKNQTVEHYDTVHSPLLDLSSPGRRNMELALVIKDETDKLEATAENDICEQSEKKTEKGDALPIEVSSSDSRMHLYKRKGKEKEKYLWDRELDERMLKDVDESHGSMESRNSAKLFSKGKRRRSFDHQFIVGSKRIKRQILESPSSNSLVKQDSSFMNWISNMVKGLAKSNEEEGPTNFPSHEREEDCNPKISTFDTTRDGCSRKMGFETVFQSIYLPSRKVNEKRTPIDNYPRGDSKELALACKSSGGIMPVSCKKMEVPNYSCKQSALRNVSGPQPKKGNDGASSSISSQGEKENTSTRCNSTDPSAEGKPISKVGNVSTACGSLWITRYSPKVPFDMSNLDDWDKNKNTRRINCSELSKSSTDIVSVASKGLQNCAPNAESSISFNKNCGNKQKKSVKQKPLESLNGPDEMTSLFARRLDALKHISSVALRDDETHTTKNCFFCGKSDHKMKDCSDIEDTELESLLRNSSLYKAAEETPCLCIKCFQLDHWAATCPLSGKVQLGGTGSKKCFSLLQSEEKESQSKLDFPCGQGKSQKRSVFSEKRNINLDEIQKHVALSIEENEIQDKQLIPMYNIAIEQTSEAPYGMFDTVRKLRLSRTNVLKWMNSHFSVSNLDGYFLRLRLGKWKEGPGGAGYYVACINGSPREKSPKGFKKHIYVTVGGIECLVESQYVSNQDFQEDELMAWWNKATGSGQIPAEADLKVKLEERKKLGF